MITMNEYNFVSTKTVCQTNRKTMQYTQYILHRKTMQYTQYILHRKRMQYTQYIIHKCQINRKRMQYTQYILHKWQTIVGVVRFSGMKTSVSGKLGMRHQLQC